MIYSTVRKAIDNHIIILCLPPSYQPCFTDVKFRCLYSLKKSLETNLKETVSGKPIAKCFKKCFPISNETTA